MRYFFEDDFMELQNLGSICSICKEHVGNPVAPDRASRTPIYTHLYLTHDIYISDENLRSRTMWYKAKQRVVR